MSAITNLQLVKDSGISGSDKITNDYRVTIFI